MGDETGGHEDQAQLSYAHILRPFPTFDTVYQGESANRWIMLQEGTDPLDENAGNTGYAANLLRGLRVPYGARLKFWLPHILTFNADGTKMQPYRFAWMYRLRNLNEFQRQRGPWHIVQSEGTPDTTGGGSSPRTLKPAGYRSFCIPQTEPTGAAPTVASREVMHCRPVDVSPFSGNPPSLPLLPSGGTGIVQQGVTDPQTVSPLSAGMPFYDIVDDVASGDELLFAVFRDIDIAANWDFTVPGGADAFFELFFTGSDNVGVNVFVGKVPAGQNSFA